jgi:serine/threonine-protein kinase
MQVAMEENISHFSVSASNLWLSHTGELLVMNYWSKTNPDAWGTKGLCRLLYQLVTRSEKFPASFHAVEEQILPGSELLSPLELNSVLHLLRFHETGSDRLSSFLKEIEFIVKNLNESGSHQAADSGNTSVLSNDETETASKMPVSKTMLLLGIPLVCLISIAGFIVLLSFKPVFLTKTEAPTAEVPKAAPPVHAEPSSQIKREEERSVKDKPNNPETVEIPLLTGLTKEEAEKAALAAGLHYTYYLETNRQSPKGIVFKQIPEARTTAEKGSSVTFWVSKGSP